MKAMLAPVHVPSIFLFVARMRNEPAAQSRAATIRSCRTDPWGSRACTESRMRNVTRRRGTARRTHEGIRTSNRTAWAASRHTAATAGIETTFCMRTCYLSTESDVNSHGVKNAGKVKRRENILPREKTASDFSRRAAWSSPYIQASPPRAPGRGLGPGRLPGNPRANCFLMCFIYIWSLSGPMICCSCTLAARNDFCMAARAWDS